MVHAFRSIRLTQTARAAAAIGLAAFFAQAQAAGYNVIDLGQRNVSLTASCTGCSRSQSRDIAALSSTGLVVENVTDVTSYPGGGAGFTHPEVVDIATLQPVTYAFPAVATARAYAINGANQVVGNGGGAQFIADTNAYRPIVAPTANLSAGVPRGINASGQVTGTFLDTTTQTVQGYVTALNAGTATLLGANVNPSSINGKAQVAGYVSATTGDTAFRTTAKGAVIKLGKLWGDKSSYASAINDAGVVVGWSRSSTGVDRAFMTNALSLIVNLNLYAPSGYTASQAVSVNNSGVAVGNGKTARGTSEPFIFSSGKLTLLNADATITASGWTLTEVRAINDKGQIAAYASQAGVSHLVVLNPQ